MKYTCISLNPPYGTLIACGAKTIETRGWSTAFRGPLLIHQTKGLGEMFDSEEELWAFCDQEPFRTTLAALGYRDASELPRSSLVAACELVAVETTDRVKSVKVIRHGDREWLWTEQEKAFGDYSPGRCAYLLADIRALPEPIPARGMPGLWEWQGEIEL